MDLHDFADVAMNYDNYLRAFGMGDDGFEEFYLSLAEEYGQAGVIDIACGTGALTIPLAKRGYDVTGMDLSEAMVNETQKKLQQNHVNADIFAANMIDFQCNRLFSLAIIARSGFMHLITPQEQRKALMNIKNHLLPGGVLTLNTFDPSPKMQAVQMDTSEHDYTLRTEYINSEGRPERIYNAIGYNPATQVMSGNWKFETLDKSGNVIDTRVRPLRMRQTYRMEMEYLLELCGFKVIAVYGGFHKEPASGNLIWIAKKTGDREGYQDVRLVLPTMDHKEAAMAHRQEYFDHGERVIHGDGGLDNTDDYEQWLKKITANMGENVAPGLVPATTYFAFAHDKIVGTIQIRHKLNEYLQNYAGHIGYGVCPTQRRKGYAGQMLALALDKCREMEIPSVLVTCSKSNTASAKTIIKNGGVLENERLDEDGTILQRYWIKIG